MMSLLSPSKTASSLKDKIDFVTAEAAEGRLEARITGIDPKDPLAKTAWNINNMLDQMEALMRNTNTALPYQKLQMVKHIEKCFVKA